TRGAQHCRLVDRGDGTSRDVLPQPAPGSTDLGLLRPAPEGGSAGLVAYVVTDAGRPRRALAAEPCGPDGHWSGPAMVACRDAAEIDFADADDAGRRMLIVWNTEGRSEVEILDLTTGESRTVPEVPGEVVSGGVLARNGLRAVLAVDSPRVPRRLWVLDVESGAWQPLTEAPPVPGNLVAPTLERFVSHDGLEVTGWLYRPPGSGPGAPAVVSIHGGPESQERPEFSAHHQMLVAAGFVVFAPNIRGSSGFGRAFVHADDRYGRLGAIADVACCADWLAAGGFADPDRIAVAGRSYGGYVTFMALALYPERFAAGAATCGMSDLLTFYRDTEPWIARAAITKYGDPERDADLLAALSPLRRAEDIRAPVLVIHGEGDTNVPVSESRQMVAALRALGRDVEYVQLDGEGHEFRRM
ncbi:MAG TPA: prolyl oligopeptidase family serine peptidase, partial [Acidimicrobiales bacterium]|nr:prolyl oligopeptidase family serine peptidase [Acidimicrobiales bacterium]